MTSPPLLAVVGTGAVGCALARSYSSAGGSVVLVVSRDPERAGRAAEWCGAGRGTADLRDVAEAEVVLVAVRDDAIRAVGRDLGECGWSGPLLHTSGSLAGSALSPTGPPAGSLHPLQTFPAASTETRDAVATLASRVPGSHWFHEGAWADEARELVKVWQGHFHVLSPGSKTLYHAGAAVLCNHAVALFDMALELFEAAGVSRQEAREPLAELMETTAANHRRLSPEAALTGPVARGDVQTIRSHLAALAASTPHLLPAYVSMALRAVTVARRSGRVGVETLDELEALLNDPPPPCS